MKKVALALSFSIFVFAGCQNNTPQPPECAKPVQTPSISSNVNLNSNKVQNEPIKITYKDKTCIIDNTHPKTCIFR